jgi:segregation and condensation protein A
MSDSSEADGPFQAQGRSFRIHDFEGPLDLLLFLIRKNEVNIYDIPIAAITEQYLEYLSYATHPDLDDLTEFYNLAATLLYIKSRMLLPVELGDEEYEDPRRELVEKIIEYQKYKKLADLMEEKEKDAEWVVERQRIQRSLPFAEEEMWTEIQVWDLLKTFSTLMSSLSSERIIDLYEEVSVNEKITLIQEKLETRGECGFGEIITARHSVMDIVCAFLAILEMVKLKMISVFQNKLFGDIRIRPAKGGSDGGV